MSYREVTLTFDSQDLDLLVYANKERVEKVWQEYQLLSLAWERDLTPQEREELPVTLVEAKREQLIEQIDAWYSLWAQWKYLLHRLEKVREKL